MVDNRLSQVNRSVVAFLNGFIQVGALEGQYYRATKKLVDFSAQQLIDCPSGQPNFTTFGCAGGIPTNAYLSISTNGGEETEVDYPYAGNAGKVCIQFRNQFRLKVNML